MSQANHNAGATLAREIEKQSQRPENRRFLRAMPLFDVDLTLPDRLRELLAQLDDVEPTDRPAGRRAN